MSNKVKKTPRMIDEALQVAAGLRRFDGKTSSELKPSITRLLRIKDEQDFVNRYVWINLPCNLSSQEVERMLYYKGQLILFYHEESDQFYIMPYALTGTIDYYQRYNTVHPVPMAQGTSAEPKAPKKDAKQETVDAYKHYVDLKEYLANIVLKVQYGIPTDDITWEMATSSAVILRDYTNQIGQENLPRYYLNDELLKFMSDIIPFMRTSLIAGCGVKGMRVADADQEDSVNEASDGMYDAAINGDIYTPITSAIDFQELTNGQPIKAQEFMLTFQSLDNFRLSTHGLSNSGVYEKKAHTNETENEMNQAQVKNQYQDGLSIRQNFCNIVNAIWGIGIWCMPSENVLNADLNGDGVIYDDNSDGASSGIEDNDYE